MACEQLAYTAVKFSNTNDDRITAHQLADIKRRIDLVGNVSSLDIQRRQCSASAHFDLFGSQRKR